MRTDKELAEAWGPICPVCLGPLGDERHLVRTIVQLKFVVNGCTEYTRVYPVCPSCKDKGELV